MEVFKATTKKGLPVTVVQTTLTGNVEADPEHTRAAGQQKLALEIARQLFPENAFQLMSTEPDISGGFHFQLKTQKQDKCLPFLKPAFKQPREVERALEALDTFKISFDHDQQMAKVQFAELGTLKSFSFQALGYKPDDKPAADLSQTTTFSYRGLHIERKYTSRTQGTYRITGQSGQQIGEGLYDQLVPYSQQARAHRVQDGRQMSWYKTDAEIKKEVDAMLQKQDARIADEPQQLFTVHPESGEVGIIGQDNQGNPVVKSPGAFKKVASPDVPPLLAVISNKGFLGNFILNFKNNYKRADLEVLTVSRSKPLPAALQQTKESLPWAGSGVAEALQARTGISGLTDKTERATVGLPEAEQQKLLGKLAADTEGDNAYTLIQENGRLKMPEEMLPKMSFLHNLSNFIALLKDEELQYPGKEALQAANPICSTPKITHAMQQPKFDPDQINWKDAEKLGLTRELLEKTDNLQRLLNGDKTSLLQGLKGDLGGVKISIDGKFRLVADPSGQPTLVFHGVKSKLDIPQDYLGYAFTEEDRKSLQQTGSLHKQVTLTDKATRESFPAYLGVDRDTNELVAIRADKIKIPDVIKGVTLTGEQKKLLAEGKPVLLSGMKDAGNQAFSATVQIDAARKGFSVQALPGAAIRETAKPESMSKDAAGQQQKKAQTARHTDAGKSQQPQAPEPTPGKKRGGPKI